jgi:hypothetical protein
MTKIALLHNHFDFGHLTSVMREMQTLGAPQIRVVHVEGDLYQAIEGCHRLRAAAALGLQPDFEELDNYTLRSEVEGLDCWDEHQDDPLAIVGSMGDWGNDTLIFDEF